MHRRSLLIGAAALGMLVYLWISHSDEQRVMREVTIVIAALTSLYALLTYEILLQNKEMAQATRRSAETMEQSLRFSFAPNLLFTTITTKNPSLNNRQRVSPIRNDEYEKALRDHVGAGQQMEFVFAVVRNVGRGTATSLRLDATYKVRDTANPNHTYTIDKTGTVQLVEPDSAIALYVYVSRAPTSDDQVELLSANLVASDLYKEALGEKLWQKSITPPDHTVEKETGCILSVT